MPWAPQEPFDEGFLQVSDVHNIYYMQCGNPQGKPVIYLHGGPGGSISTNDMAFFDPEKYRVIFFSQRGAGKSTPTADLQENTTWDLVEDIEKIREKVRVDKWMVFGGSWGSTLALAYSQTYPNRCTSLILRGIFLLTTVELDYFYQSGTKHIWPAEWDEYASRIPESRRHNDIISAYYDLLTDPDDNISLPAAQAWSKYEYSCSKLFQDPVQVAKAQEEPGWARAFARIECHYFINHGFMPEGHLVTEPQISKIRHLPCIIINGRYDCICPPRTAYKLYKAYGENAKLVMVDDAGHSSQETGIKRELCKATDEFYRYQEA